MKINFVSVLLHPQAELVGLSEINSDRVSCRDGGITNVLSLTFQYIFYWGQTHRMSSHAVPMIVFKSIPKNVQSNQSNLFSFQNMGQHWKTLLLGIL